MSVPYPVGEGEVRSPNFAQNISSSYEPENLDKYAYFAQSEETVGIISFVDENAGLSIGQSAGNHNMSEHDATHDTNIDEFFKRPVRIDNYTWLESDVVGVKQTIYPWFLWADNAYVRNKLNNYAFIRGDLHVKVVINASPFYYGMTQISYLPLQADKPSTIINDTGTRYLIPYSQRPRLVLDPQQQEAGHIVLPFVFDANYLYNVSGLDLRIWAN